MGHTSTILSALGDIVAIEDVGALVQVGAVNLQPVAQFRRLVPVLPGQGTIFWEARKLDEVVVDCLQLVRQRIDARNGKRK
jgi:hypothetical protein